MAFADLNPLGALWQRRGLHCLLLPQDAPASCSLCREPTPGAPPAPKKKPAPAAASHVRLPPASAAPSRGMRAAQGYAARAAENEARQRARGERSEQKERADRATGAVQPALGRSAPARNEDAWRPLPPHTWPAPWQQRLAATRPGLVLWTYWKLGQDLEGLRDEGQAARRAFLQRLLADLGHPGGTHTFWPACLPTASALRSGSPTASRDALAVPPASSGAAAPHGMEGSAPCGDAAANPDAFWSGVSRLGARGVVVMGSAAVKALALPGTLRPLQQTRHRGHLVWVLWDVDYLLHEEQRYAAMLAFLRRALRQVTRA